ncbi:hypothetical protein THRCLA_03506 [Thraustotheca clavata]|uniref:M96 mating-specific protein family n=1 Tax=Thraustotheca clavata TaxID=74557 RepID=A0A1W0A236_9STRA|nr:hypothetical protein THRCLA_03506 [Thraustotheca clavata]
MAGNTSFFPTAEDADLLDDIVAMTDRSTPASDTSDSPEPTRKRVRKRHTDELKYLREKLNEFTNQLNAMKQLKAVENQYSSPWQGISRRQAQARAVAEQENAKLKQAVEEQLKVTEALMRIVSKRPKLTEVPYIEDWKIQKLPAELTRRIIALNAIVDSKYEQLEGIFVRLKIHDLEENTHYSNVVYDASSDSVRLEWSCVRTINTDFTISSEALWSMMSIRTEQKLAASTYKCLQVIDQNVHYIRRESKLGDDPVESNLICKKYELPGRLVIIGDTVLEDELFEYSKDVFISNETTWIEMEKIDANATRIRHCVSAVMPCKSKRDASTNLFHVENTPPKPTHFYMAFANLVLESFQTNLLDMMSYVRHKVEAKLGPNIEACPISALKKKILGF